MDLSIIIPSFKRADLLKYGLQSLTYQKVSSPFEVIVLNDGVADETQKVCDSFKDKLNIRYIFTGHRNIPDPIWRIPGFAINIGAKLAHGKYMIIMCPEIYLLDNCLQSMIETMRRNPKGIVITAGKDDQDETFLNNVRQDAPKDKLADLYETMPKLNTEFPFFLGVATEEFVRIGGYDEDFIGNCWDDQDIVMRLKQDGCSYITLRSRIVHLYHSRLRYESAKIKEMWDYNKDVYDRKLGTIKRNVGRMWGSLIPTLETRRPNAIEKYFTSIYEKNTWSGKESRSGTGSDLINTAVMRPLLVDLINSLNVESMLDLPCGDFNWMKEIIGELQIKEYLGGDIIPVMLKENELKYSGMPIVAAPRFAYLNMIEDVPPKVDLIFCRDGLVHLSFKNVIKALKNFVASGSTYLITTTFTDKSRHYPDIDDGGWHPINFQLPPFNFPPPYNIIVEKCTECNGIYTDKSLALWKLSELKEILEPTPAKVISAEARAEKESKIKIEPVGKPRPLLNANRTVKLRVAHIHPWWDSAGVGIIHTQMMNQHTDIEVRHIVAGNTCLNHETDLILDKHDSEIRRILTQSDILHFNTFWYDDPQLPIKFPWEDYMRGKKVVFHMHGGSICFDYKKLEDISKNATVVTCSPLIPKFMPFATWVPNILPIDEPQCLPKTRVTDLPARFLFMVNHDHNKGRAEVEWLFHKLNSVYGYNIPFESWLHKYPYMEGLEKRKSFDIVIDNITQGFIGMVGWETLSQAQVCIARLSPIVAENYAKLGNGEAPPIVNVSGIDEMAKTIIDLSTNVTKVREIQKKGREWMEKYYSPRRLCELWEERYLRIAKG